MIYQVVKDNMVFYVQTEEKALQYLKDGYTVYRQIKLKIGDNGKLEEDLPKHEDTTVVINKSERRNIK